MNVLCGWMAFLAIMTAIAYSIVRENVEYMVEFMLGVFFVIGIWIALII